MADPHAIIRYVANGDHESRKVSETTVHGPDAIAVVLAARRRMREINGNGGAILYIDFMTNGAHRRRYVDGRVTRRRRSLTGDD